MAILNGIICVNKPQQFTSFDVVAKLRGMTKTKKVGHAGTLDPMATGVLPVFFGGATKACGFLPDDTKSYLAHFQLGLTTDTDDIWGKELSKEEPHFLHSEVEECLKQFLGEIKQVPPMYSAIRVNGKRLYDLARQGIVVDREPRAVTVFSLRLLSFDEENQQGCFSITCSKGTYIRTICHDLGERLGCGAVMSGLVRDRVGGFTLEDCYTLEELQSCAECNDFSAVLLPVDRLFAKYPKIKLNEAQSRMFANGRRLDLNRVRYESDNQIHTVYTHDGSFMGLARPDKAQMELVIEKMLMERK